MGTAKKEASLHGGLFAKEIMNGRKIARCGAWLLLGGPLFGFTGSMVGAYKRYNIFENEGLSNPGAIAAAMSLSMKATTIGQFLGLFGIIFLMISQFYCKYRARWSNKSLVVVAILCFIMAFPFGIFFGILLVTAVAQRDDFHQDETSSPGSSVREPGSEPLSFNEPDDLVILRETNASGLSVGVEQATFLAWRDASVGFVSVSAHRMIELERHGESAGQVHAAACSANLFETLGVAPWLGRTFIAEEEQTRGNKVIMLSNEFWEGHFVGQPEIIGRTIELGGQVRTIVGVMPPGFRYPPEAVDAWVPLDFQEADGDHGLTVTARVLPGITPEQAEERLRLIPLSCGHEVSVLTLRDVLAGK